MKTLNAFKRNEADYFSTIKCTFSSRLLIAAVSLRASRWRDRALRSEREPTESGNCCRCFTFRLYGGEVRARDLLAGAVRIESFVLIIFIGNSLSICSLQFPQPEEAQCLYAAVDEAIEASSVAQGVRMIDPQG